MQRIATPSSVDGKFVGFSAQDGTTPTELSPEWCTTIQEEPANVVEGAGFPLDPSDNKQLLKAILSFVAPSVFAKNPLINSGFRLHQRILYDPNSIATITIDSSSTDPYAHPDRWRFAIPEGAGEATVQVRPHPLDLSGEDLPQDLGTPEFFMRYEVTTAFPGPTLPAFAQRIEGVRTFAGLKVVASPYMRINSGTTTVKPVLRQNFGSGTGASSQVVYEGSPLTLTSSWTRYAQVFDLATLAGKSLGAPLPADPDDYLELSFEMESGEVFQLDISHPQIERGTTPTEYAGRPFATELAMAQRFYESSYDIDQGLGAGGNAARGAVHSVWDGSGPEVGPKSLASRFQVTKRAIPTVTWRNFGTTTPDELFWGSVRAVTATVETTHDSTGLPQCSTQPGGMALAIGQWVAEAEL